MGLFQNISFMSETIQDEGAKTIGVYAASNRRIFTLKVERMFVQKWRAPCRRCVEKSVSFA
jgi:hypothetical protein